MEDKNKNSVYVINFETIEAPKFNETKNQDWIKYGDDNRYPNHLYDLYNTCALHGSICRGKIDYAVGDGVSYEGKANKKADQLIKDVYRGEDFDTFFRKIVSDYVITGCYCFTIIKDKKENRIYYQHYAVDTIRVPERNEYGEYEKFYYSKDWSKWRKDGYKPTEIPAYKYGSDKEERMICFETYTPGYKYYALPSYQSAMKYIQVDVGISDYHSSHLDNGMQAGHLITYMNIPDQEEREDIISKHKTKQTGTKNTGKDIIAFAKSKETAPSVQSIAPTGLANQFDQLHKIIEQNILTAHGVVSPLLLGIKTEGQLGGNNELVTAFKLFYKTRIIPIQKECMKEINKINLEYGYPEFIVTTSSPVEFVWSDQILLQILTEDEMRADIGRDPKQIVAQATIENNI